MKIIHGEGVFEELVEISFHIALDNEDAAQDFLNSCDETFQFLAANKNVGTIKNFENSLFSGVRMWRVKGYEKYLIFYQPFADGIRILHIVHGARNYNLLFEDEK
jgi:toxin ParE1/3/4